jgi:hypothetical protein
MATPDVQPVRNSRLLRRRLLVLAVAVALGMALHLVAAERLQEIATLAERDPMTARAELAAILHVVAVGLFGLTGTIGLVLGVACRRAVALDRFPPPGAWGLGDARVWTGPAARRIAMVMGALALLLVLCSVAGAAITWVMAERLLACRAG